MTQHAGFLQVYSRFSPFPYIRKRALNFPISWKRHI